MIEAGPRVEVGKVERGEIGYVPPARCGQHPQDRPSLDGDFAAFEEILPL